jgi:hypothetical protein
MKRVPEPAADRDARYAALCTQLPQIPVGWEAAIGRRAEFDEAMGLVEAAGKSPAEAYSIIERCCSFITAYRDDATHAATAERVLAWFKRDLEFLKALCNSVEKRLGVKDGTTSHLRKRIAAYEQWLRDGPGKAIHDTARPGNTSDKLYRPGFDAMMRYVVQEQQLTNPPGTKSAAARLMHLVLKWSLLADAVTEVDLRGVERLAEFAELLPDEMFGPAWEKVAEKYIKACAEQSVLDDHRKPEHIENGLYVQLESAFSPGGNLDKVPEQQRILKSVQYYVGTITKELAANRDAYRKLLDELSKPRRSDPYAEDYIKTLLSSPERFNSRYK